MYKNQLQELAQRSCFNLPSYACIREGPDHAPRFKASVNFNGEIFEAPSYSSTLRQAEHAAAEVALSTLSTRGPSRSSLTARVLDETGVYKNLLQETAHRAGLNLPVYTTVRSGPGHLPVFTSSVELAGMNFNGEPARTKKQAEKNTAMSAWSALKQMSNVGSLHHKETESTEEQEHVIVARVLSNFRTKDENKFSRQKEQNQVRRRNMALGYKNNKNPSLQQHQQWRSVGQFSDFSSVFSIQRQNHQRNNSLLALASPSESTTSKILPPQTSSSTTKSNSFFLSSILEEHQRDEEEWLNGKSEIKDKPIEKIDLIKANPVFRSNPIPQRQFIPTQITTRTYGPPHPTSVAPMFTPNIFISGGYHGHNHIAPAVQIRSVIPVCAAPPPMRSPPLQAPPPQKKEQQEIPAEREYVVGIEEALIDVWSERDKKEHNRTGGRADERVERTLNVGWRTNKCSDKCIH